MLFNSISFAVFFPTVFFLYWFVFERSFKLQNILLLLASYYFYGCRDWRFLFLLTFSIFLDYSTGLKIHNVERPKSRKFWLVLSIGINLGLLGFFKYYNFFVESFADLMREFWFNPNIATLNIILPVGISFYTFHGLSYVLDIYNRKIEPSGESDKAEDHWRFYFNVSCTSGKCNGCGYKGIPITNGIYGNDRSDYSIRVY